MPIVGEQNKPLDLLAAENQLQLNTTQSFNLSQKGPHASQAKTAKPLQCWP